MKHTELSEAFFNVFTVQLISWMSMGPIAAQNVPLKMYSNYYIYRFVFPNFLY